MTIANKEYLNGLERRMKLPAKIFYKRSLNKGNSFKWPLSCVQDLFKDKYIKWRGKSKWLRCAYGPENLSQALYYWAKAGYLILILKKRKTSKCI